MIRKYNNHKPQTTPLHRDEEPLNHHVTPGRQIKQSNQLSLPHQDDCNTRIDIKYHFQIFWWHQNDSNEASKLRLVYLSALSADNTVQPDLQS